MRFLPPRRCSQPLPADPRPRRRTPPSFPATSRPAVRPARRRTMNQNVFRSHVRQNVGYCSKIPTFWRTRLRIRPTKKARCLCDTGLLKAPVGKSIRCHCLRRYGCEFVLEMVSIFCDGQPTTAGTPTATANRLRNPSWACRPVSLVASSFCQPCLTIFAPESQA